MVGIGGPQAPSGQGWGAPGGPAPQAPGSPVPEPKGSGNDTLLIALASVVALVALVGGTVFVLGQRSDESSGPPVTSGTTDPTRDTSTDPSTSSTEDTIATSVVLGGRDSYEDYSTVDDATSSISVELPDAWVDLFTGPITIDSATDTDVPGIVASTDGEAFLDGLTTSGAELLLYDSSFTLGELSSYVDDSCLSDEGESSAETTSGLQGTFVLYSDCTGGDGVDSDGLIFQGLFEVDRSTVLYINVNMQIDADREALARILDSVDVT